MNAHRLETIVLGAGPAGLQMAHELSAAGRECLVLEAGEGPGTFFTRYPRHRKLISINKLYTGFDDREKNLRWDWNSLLSDDDALLFRHYSRRYWPDAGDLVRYLGDFARRFELPIRYRTEIIRIERDADGFTLVDAHGEVHRSERLIVASGVCRPYVPPIPGIEHCENYVDVDIDPETFAGQRVLILGKGNSAFEMAELLTETTALLHVCSPHPVKLAWVTHHVGHLRAINNNLLDTYQLKIQNAVLDADVQRIDRRGGKLVATIAYTHAEGEVEEIAYDRIIVCTGFRVDTSIFAPSAMPELMIHGRFPAQTSAWESVNVPGMYFAGTLMQARDFKKTSSGFIHGFRYNIRALHRILEARYHGRELPWRPLEATPEACAEAVLAAINRSSALWQQFGFLGDVIHVTDGGALRYYEALPAGYVHDTLMAEAREYYVVTLEYGTGRTGDHLAVPRVHKDAADRGRESQFLHPVIRRFDRGRPVTEHHVIEDLEASWVEKVHTNPLLTFLFEQLANRRTLAPRA